MLAAAIATENATALIGETLSCFIACSLRFIELRGLLLVLPLQHRCNTKKGAEMKNREQILGAQGQLRNSPHRLRRNFSKACQALRFRRFDKTTERTTKWTFRCVGCVCQPRASPHRNSDRSSPT